MYTYTHIISRFREGCVCLHVYIKTWIKFGKQKNMKELPVHQYPRWHWCLNIFVSPPRCFLWARMHRGLLAFSPVFFPLLHTLSQCHPRSGLQVDGISIPKKLTRDTTSWTLPRPAESNLLGWGPGIWDLTYPLGDSDGQEELEKHWPIAYRIMFLSQ